MTNATNAARTANRSRISSFHVPASLAAAIAALVLIAWVSAIVPWWQIYMMDPDEGINLGKAALVARGVPPYGAMWNDQPPVLTYLLAALQWVFPYDVSAARALILATAGLMVWSLYRICYRVAGHPAAIVALLLLATSPLFIDLSASVMIGLPAVALAVVALDIASSPIRPPLLRCVLAGVVMALSLQTKLFTFTAVPTLLFLGWVSVDAGLSARLKLVAAMVGGLLAAFLLIVLVSGEPLFQQLVGTHLGGNVRKSYNLVGSLTAIWQVLEQHVPLLTAAGLGAALGLTAVMKHGWAPLLWLAVAAGSLAGHTPIWSHQVLLLIVPLAWLGGIGWGDALARHGRGLLLALPIATVLVWSGWSGFAIASRSQDGYGPSGRAAAAEFARFSHLGNLVATDLPMDAFRARLLVPPEFAVFSMKRLLQGSITQQEMVQVLDTYKPVQASFRRFEMGALVTDYLDDNYWMVPMADGAPHYIRKGAALAGFEREAAIAGLTEMLGRLIATSVEGGYAGLVDPVSGARYERSASEKPIGDRAIVVRPPGSTPRVGQCLLRLANLTGSAELRGAALAAGEATVCGQGVEGGWGEAPVLPNACAAVSPPVEPMTTNATDMLDEGAPAKAIDFLLSLRGSDSAQTVRFRQSAQAGLDFLVNAQNRDGGWPFKLTDWTYYRYSTLNDGVTTEAIRTLVKGFETFGVPRYRDAALKGVQFLLNVQSANGAWAQQYDASGKPGKARAFEPVAYASLETARAMLTIADFYQMTESETLKMALLTAREWLAGRELGGEGWARFYEFDTDRAVFGDRDGSIHYDIAEISEERRQGYDWIERFPAVEEALAVARAAEGSPQAVPHVRARWARDQQALSVTANHDALVAFSASGGVGAELDANGMISTRKAVETCEMVLDALEISGI